MQKILSISEAHSQQPIFLSTLTQQQYEKYYDKPRACKEIKLELVTIGTPENGDAVWMYVGYNFQGEKLFMFIASSVNVQFQTL